MSLPLAPIVRTFAGTVTALLALGLVQAAEPIPAGWFAWPAVEPADGSALDVSALNRSPDGKLPRIAARDGQFVTPDGQRVHFWGCNLTASEAFPATAAEADAIARRLAKGGVSIARLHHLDNPWAIASGGSIWPKGRPEHRELDPVQLDKLHRFIAALRDHGIYSNLNLKVSKTLVAADGFPESVTQIPDFQKRADIFDRRMIDLQKDYARRLLTTKNPYTGLAPADDPAVAVIELNNENSLLGFWTRDLGRNLEKLPPAFRDELQGLWNTWLARHYANDETLAHAWAPTVSSRGALIAGDVPWKLMLHGGATAEILAGPDAGSQEIRVVATSGVAHHVQLSTGRLPIADGAIYTVEFLARADHPRKLGVGVGIDLAAQPKESWRSFGLLDTIEVGTEWQPVRRTFPAHSVAGALGSLSLNAGQSTGSIWIKNLRMIPDAPDAGLQPGQSVTAKSVPIPTAPSTRQWADWIQFLADTERAFADEMRDYLKNDLHVQAPIVCSQIDYGGLTGLNREQHMDFADGHAYWQHPEFGGKGSWDSENWTIRNTPQLVEFSDRAFGELGVLALVRVAGKPFTVSEYDHPAPSEFACEMYPTLASFACRQDWDIVYPFCIGAYGANNPDGRIRGFFDQLHHPAKWGQSPFAAVVFRRSLIPPAANRAELVLGSPLWAEQPHADVLWRQLTAGHSLDFLNTRYAVSDRPGAVGAKARMTLREGHEEPPIRLLSQPQGRVYAIAAEQAAGAIGYLGGGSVDVGALHVSCARFGRDFASVTAIALDGKPLRDSSRVLVTVVGRAGNQGATWNETRTSLGKNSGHGPTIAEHVPAKITLDGSPRRKVFALGPDGARTKAIEVHATDGALAFVVGDSDHALHYEIVAL